MKNKLKTKEDLLQKVEELEKHLNIIYKYLGEIAQEIGSSIK